MNSKIPGNQYSEIKIWSDTTREYLAAHLAKVVGHQQANMRHNPRYVRHVRALRKAIEARS
jgi:hypothetical protein